MSLFVPDCLEELRAAVSHPHCDDLCLTHLSTVKRVSIRKKKDAPHIHMFCISAWARMTFHFLLQVISEGLIQFALQAVSNPLSLLNFSLHRLNTRTFAV